MLVCAAATTARAEAVHGTVRDRATKAPVAGAILTAGSELAATDDAGGFTMELPPGRYTLAVSADFLVPRSLPIVVVAGQPLELALEVDPAEHANGETIDVVGTAATAPGESHVDAGFARTLPGGGDAAKIVQSMPAVARSSAGSTDIVVWGAAPSETRVFVDGVPVPALYHVGGYRSAVGNESDRRHPAHARGVRRRPRARDRRRDRYRPRRSGGRPRVARAGRRARWQRRGAHEDRQARDRGRDPPELARAGGRGRRESAAARAERAAAAMDRRADRRRAPLADRVVLSAWAIGAIDSLQRTLASDDPATRTTENTDQRFARAQVTLRRDRDDGHDSVTVWGGRDRSSDDYLFGTIPADISNRSWVGGARAVQQNWLGDDAALTIGADVDGEQAQLARDGSLTIPAREGDSVIFGQPPGLDYNSDAWHATTIDAAGHASVDLHDGPISATLGLRADSWLLGASRVLPPVGTSPAFGSQQILMNLDPRASVQARLTDELVVRVDGGRYHQARDASDTSAVFGTPGLGLEQAWHLVVGAQWRRGVGAVEVAAYARDLDDLVVRDIAVTPPLGAVLTQNGTGTVRGVQLTARLVGWHGLSGWLSYNLSRSLRDDDPSEPTRFFDHD